MSLGGQFGDVRYSYFATRRAWYLGLELPHVVAGRFVLPNNDGSVSFGRFCKAKTRLLCVRPNQLGEMTCKSVTRRTFKPLYCEVYASYFSSALTPSS